ncbi:glycosyltransferase family 2 protein [Mesorhizobium sp. AR10]|uniref:glycosyltransferase family 2 protein n=1 Tax=Mesorhizobium sp. AR10 TaxID=2865839 RepID=UPI00215F609E|nr:glycosyltransferase family 2 protein [Mesorhizobium sp. AR10]UVK40246.1 glycosyltransferase family 2 protein [Mesorhizobium sp. AR10]
MELAIIVVNYRTADLTIECLAALLDDPTLPADTHIMVVDGASGDDSVPVLTAEIETRDLQRRISLLPLAINGGFAYANNRGIEAIGSTYGKPEFYLLLNPDTVARPGAVARLLEFLKTDPAIGIAGSRLEDPDGTPQACAFRFLSVASEFEAEIKTGLVSNLLSRWRVVPPDLPEEPSRVGWVSGACMLVRRDVFEAVGLMDEEYFLYYEELDFCLRAARANWQCWHVPQSRVIHFVGQSTGVSRREGKKARRPSYWFESRKRYFTKNHGRRYAFMANLAWIAGYMGWRVRQILTGRKNEDPPHLLRDFVRHNFFFGRP